MIQRVPNSSMEEEAISPIVDFLLIVKQPFLLDNSDGARETLLRFAREIAPDLVTNVDLENIRRVYGSAAGIATRLYLDTLIYQHVFGWAHGPFLQYQCDYCPNKPIFRAEEPDPKGINQDVACPFCHTVETHQYYGSKASHGTE